MLFAFQNQNGVSQFGLYLLEVLLSEGKEGQVRKERPSVASGVPVVWQGIAG